MTILPPDASRRQIRPFRDADEAEVVQVWCRAGQAAYPYLPTWQALTLETAQRIFHEVIRTRCTIWVGTDDEHIVAYLAMKGSYIDRLYVDPQVWRHGWGVRLITFAKGQSPQGLELHTHQANQAARALYEAQGFQAVAFGISPPPESAPDVEYHWRP